MQHRFAKTKKAVYLPKQKQKMKNCGSFVYENDVLTQLGKNLQNFVIIKKYFSIDNQVYKITILYIAKFQVFEKTLEKMLTY